MIILEIIILEWSSSKWIYFFLFFHFIVRKMKHLIFRSFYDDCKQFKYVFPLHIPFHSHPVPTLYPNISQWTPILNPKPASFKNTFLAFTRKDWWPDHKLYFAPSAISSAKDVPEVWMKPPPSSSEPVIMVCKTASWESRLLIKRALFSLPALILSPQVDDNKGGLFDPGPFAPTHSSRLLSILFLVEGGRLCRGCDKDGL